MPNTVASADELLSRYRAGERHFEGVQLTNADLRGQELSGINLRGAHLMGADLRDAHVVDANLTRANFFGADLSGAKLWRAIAPKASFGKARMVYVGLGDADLTGADLEGANLSEGLLRGANLSGADLQNAQLQYADLTRASFRRAHLLGADFRGAQLGDNLLLDVDLHAFCTHRGSLRQLISSTVDHFAIVRSLGAPGLAEFLVGTGMPHVVATYLIDSVRSLSESDLFQLLHSTFISYGHPDEPFARKLYEALAANGVRTWFFPEDAVPGEDLRDVMWRGVNKHDRMLLICSESSLLRAGVLNEIKEVLKREAREGAQRHLIPVLFDDYALTKWDPPGQPGMAQAVRDRVCADFRDPTQFDKQLVRLIDALKKVRPESRKASA